MSIHRRDHQKRAAALVVACLALAACGSDDDDDAAPAATSAAAADTAPTTAAVPEDPDAAPLDEPTSLRIASLKTLNWAPLFVAQAKGYFTDENVEIEIVDSTGQEVQPLVAAGTVDAGLIGLNAGFFNGRANGLDVSIVGGGGESRPGEPLTAFIARTDGPASTVEELAGQRIGVPGGPGSLTHYYLGKLLADHGLTTDDVEMVPVSFVDGYAALENGALASTVSSAPSLTQLLSDGQHVTLGDLSELLDLGSGGVIVFGPTLLQGNRRAGAALLRALYRASAEDLTGDWRENEEVVSIIAEATGIPPEAITAGPLQTFDPALGFSSDLTAEMQGFYRDEGVLSYAADYSASELIDQAMMDATRQSVRNS